MPKLSVIIPVAAGRRPDVTLMSLARQTRVPDEIIVVEDRWRNANAARNNGFEWSSGALVLFSDDDIEWKPHAMDTMENILMNSTAAGVYPSYIRHSEEKSEVVGAVEWDLDRLKRQNYITTMTMIWAHKFPGFDPQVRRLQDWDLWLTMAERGHDLIYAGEVLFETSVTPTGITKHKDLEDWAKAERFVRDRHKEFCGVREDGRLYPVDR